MRFNALSAILLFPLAFARASQPIQVYLHPTPTAPSHLQSPPTLTADQAKAVLAHHLGQQIDIFDEIPQDEGIWSHLMTMWKGESENQKAKVVVIEGGVTPQDVLPTTLSTSPSFYLNEESSTRALLVPYLQRASHLLSHILDAIPALAKSFKDVFDLAGTEAAATISHEVSCLIAMADSMPWSDPSKQVHPWEAVSISSLGQVDRGNEVWETGRQGVRAGLEAMTTPNSPRLLLIIRPSNVGQKHVSKRAERRAQSDLTSCYSSNSTCSNSTTCYGRGVCALKSSTSAGECWGCKCANGYAGVQCQKEDYTMPFVIIVFSSLLLVGMVMGSVMLLYTVGETKLPSTLTLAIGGNMKRD